MKISFRARVHAGVVCLMIVFSVTLVAVLAPWLYNDKSNLLQEVTGQVAANGAHLLTERLGEWKEELKSYSEWSAERKGGMRMTPSFVFSGRSPFLAAGVLIRNSKSDWEFSSLERNTKYPSSEISSHNTEFLRNLNFKEMNLASLVAEEARIVHVPKESGEVLFAVMTLVGAASGNDGNAKISLGLTTERSFSDLTRAFKGSFTEYYIVDQNGRVVAHPNDALVGTRLSHNPTVAHIQQSSRKSFGGEISDDSETAVYSNYVRLAGSNLISIATAPLRSSQAPLKSALFFAVLASFILTGVLLFSLRAVWANQDRTWRLFAASVRDFRKGIDPDPSHLDGVQATEGELRLMTDVRTEIDEMIKSRRSLVESASFSEISDRTSLTSSTQTMSPQFKISKTVSPEMAFEEAAPTNEVKTPSKILSPEALLSLRLEAFEEAGQGITKELRNPVAAVLGHVQLAKSKSDNPELQKHLSFIDREVRHIKDVTDKITKMGFYRTLQLSPRDSSLIVSDALALAEVEVQMAGVRLHKDFFPVPQIRVSETEFVKVLSEVIVGRARAMEKSTTKNLIVHIEPKEDRVLIRIEDNAPVLLQDEIASLVRPFDPQALSFVGLNFKLLNLGALMLTHGGRVSVTAGVNSDCGNMIVLDLPGHFEKSDMAAVSPATLDESYSFLEKKLPGIVDVVAVELEKESETGSDLPIPPPAPGTLNEFSVKIRRPRLNL